MSRLVWIAAILLLGIAWTLLQTKLWTDKREAEKWQKFMKVEHCVKLDSGFYRCDSGEYRGR